MPDKHTTKPTKSKVAEPTNTSSPQGDAHPAQVNGANPAKSASSEFQPSKPTGLGADILLAKQAYIARVLASFPKELQELNQWVIWRYEPNPKKAKPDKVPYEPATGYKASVTNPHTWGSFDEACAAYLKGRRKADHLGDYAGLGFVFSPDDPYTGIDFDGYVVSGLIDPDLWTYAAQLHGYKEVSPSKRGVHSIVRAKLSGKGKRDDEIGIEMYDQGRFFTVTGDTLPDTATEINDCQEAVTELYDRLKQASPTTSIPLHRSNAQPDVPSIALRIVPSR